MPTKKKIMTKEQIIETFDPSQPGLADATIFGLPFTGMKQNKRRYLLLILQM